MALKKTFENKDGGTSNGYYRVREVGTHYEKDKDEPTSLAASFVVELYDYDTGERVENVYSGNRLVEPTTVWSPERIGVYNLTLPDLEPVQNLIIKAYDHLKTLPEFDGATDC
tara:strand:- start:918 stop:1256 length:339 start_codon:yes stop_codon:yes gene_type:complete